MTRMSAGRPESPLRAPSSGNAIPALLARARTASGNERRSWRMTKPNASPPTPQPKQWKMFFWGLTVNEGVFSAWNGQRPFQCDPALRRFTNRPTRSTMSTAARMSSSSVCEYCISRSSSLPSSTDLQRGHGRSRSALGRLTVTEGIDQGVARQQIAHRLAQGPAALAMHQSYARQAREKGIVEIFLDAVPGLVGRLSKQQDLAGDGTGEG